MDQYIEFLSNHYLLTFAFIVVTYLLIQDLLENILSKVDSLSPLLAVTKMNTDEVFIIDLRDSHDYLKGHIEGADNIPLGDLEEKLSTLDAYKHSDVLLVCQTGTRTTAASKTLAKVGFDHMLSLKGGMQSWEDNKLPMIIKHQKK